MVETLTVMVGFDPSEDFATGHTVRYFQCNHCHIFSTSSETDAVLHQVTCQIRGMWRTWG